jgi:hypothetical protein
VVASGDPRCTTGMNAKRLLKCLMKSSHLLRWGTFAMTEWDY